MTSRYQAQWALRLAELTWEKAKEDLRNRNARISPYLDDWDDKPDSLRNKEAKVYVDTFDMATRLGCVIVLPDGRTWGSGDYVEVHDG